MYNQFLYLMETKKQKQTICIVGNGWASYYLAKNLDKNKFDIVVIAPNSHVLNTPKLVDYALNIIDNVPYIPNNYMDVHIDNTVMDVDFDINKLYLKPCNGEVQTTEYDIVVFAIGSVVNTFNTPGVKEHAYFLKTIEDAIALRKIVKNVTNINIVGSGPVGIEFALKSSIPIITLYEGKLDILPNIQSDLFRGKILKELSLNNISTRLGTIIKEVDDRGNYSLSETPLMDLHKKLYCYGDAHIVLWCSGVKPNDTEKQLVEKLQIKPGTKVDNFFTPTHLTYKNVHCIGDMVINQGPPTAQNAKNQAKWLANYLNNSNKIDRNFFSQYQPHSRGTIIHCKDGIFIDTKLYKGKIIRPFSDIVVKFIEWLD